MTVVIVLIHLFSTLVKMNVDYVMVEMSVLVDLFILKKKIMQIGIWQRIVI